MAPPDPQTRRISRAKSDRNLLLLRTWSAQPETSSANESDLRMITAFIRTTRRAYDHLREASKTDSACAAWACFSLLELRILARYLARSPETRRGFRQTMAGELDDFLTLQAEIAGQLLPPAMQLRDALAQNLPRRKAGAISPAAKCPPIARIAAELGLAQEYKQMKRLTLAWARPTALSVLSTEDDLNQEASRELLFHLGGKYVSEILQDLIPLARRMALEPETFLM